MGRRRFIALACGILLATLAPQAAVASAEAQRGLLLGFKFGHPLLVDATGQNHQSNVAGRGIGNPQAGYLNLLAREGALFTASYGVTHPSQPNYIALYAGSTRNVAGDGCLRHPLTGPNLGSELTAAGLTFAGYAESLPPGGPRICTQGNYARKHIPWSDFSTVPRSATRPMSAFPQGNYAALATVSLIIPNLCNDMHNCSVATGDAWLRSRLGGYARWALRHDSLLIVTFDEDDGMHHNRIATIVAGQQVRPGRYGRSITHYNVLRTIEQAYGLPYLGRAGASTRAHARAGRKLDRHREHHLQPPPAPDGVRRALARPGPGRPPSLDCEGLPPAQQRPQDRAVHPPHRVPPREGPCPCAHRRGPPAGDRHARRRDRDDPGFRRPPRGARRAHR